MLEMSNDLRKISHPSPPKKNILTEIIFFVNVIGEYFSDLYQEYVDISKRKFREYLLDV